MRGDPFFGHRLRILREKRGLSQSDIASILQLNDRQTVSAIERGQRELAADELVLILNKLDVPLEYFTDRYRLDGEANFAWSQNGISPQALDEYELTAGCWVGAYRVLSTEVGEHLPLLRRSLTLTRNANFDDAVVAAERFASEFALGPIPALKLAETMEKRLGILVLMVDAPTGIFGAACRTQELDAALIARSDSIGRRNITLAHELFHILTWDALPPNRVDCESTRSEYKLKQHARTFASALLIPSNQLDEFKNFKQLSQSELIAKLNLTAERLAVSSTALAGRLVDLKLITKDLVDAIPAAALIDNGCPCSFLTEKPALFSKKWVEVLSNAILLGIVSTRRAAKLVDGSIEKLQSLFDSHGIQHAINL